jgi:polysaccharide biosynthesis transport protein
MAVTIQDYRRVFRERWLVLVVVILLCVGASAAAHSLRSPEYTAELQMYVAARTIPLNQTPLQGAELAQKKVKSVVDLATSNRVTTAVVLLRGLRTSPDELASRITASSGTDSVVITVLVTDHSAEESAATVNAVGEVLSRLVDELERAGSAPDAAPLSVVAVPTAPSSSSLPRMLILGLLVGCAAGIATALVRNATDNSIKSATQLHEASGGPNLGMITYHPKAPKAPLIVHDDPQSRAAEAFRRLRTNVQFVDFGNPHKALIVTSALPREGRTTTLVNLAVALASAGTSVLIIEADLRNPNAARILGMDGSVGLTSVLAGHVPIRQAIQRWKGGKIDVLASGPLPPNPSELLASPQMRALLTEARQHYGVVLIDTPALIPMTDAAAIAPVTDGAILLCRDRRTTRPEIEAAAETLRAVGAPILGTVLTMVTPSDAGAATPNKRTTNKRAANTAGGRLAPGERSPGGRFSGRPHPLPETVDASPRHANGSNS